MVMLKFLSALIASSAADQRKAYIRDTDLEIRDVHITRGELQGTAVGPRELGHFVASGEAAQC